LTDHYVDDYSVEVQTGLVLSTVYIESKKSQHNVAVITIVLLLVIMNTDAKLQPITSYNYY